MMKKMMWVFGTVGFIGTTFLSAGVNLMMVSTGSATLLTAVTLNNDTVRRAVGLPILQVQAPVYKAPRPPTAPGITGLRQRLEHNLGDMKKGWSEQVSNYTGQHVGTDEERAEKKRKETLKKMEEMRKQMERDEFQKKYKGRQ
jgi:YidC/Oxa1 family membrane protein insertase